MQSLIDIVVELHVVRIGEVFDTEISLCRLNSGLVERNLFILLVDCVIAVNSVLTVLLFTRSISNQSMNKGICSPVHVAGIDTLTGNNQRCTSLINQDRVDLVDDSEIKLALCKFFLICNHVVTQIIEAELVVGSISDVSLIRVLAIIALERIDNAADSQP